jgi:hypothetical protein
MVVTTMVVTHRFRQSGGRREVDRAIHEVVMFAYSIGENQRRGGSMRQAVEHVGDACIC